MNAPLLLGVESRSEAGGTEPAAEPASTASVRARRARNSGDERRAAPPGGGPISSPAKSQGSPEPRDVQGQSLGRVRPPEAGAPKAAHLLGQCPTRFLACRVDWLTIAFAVGLPEPIVACLAERLEAAETAGMADIKVAGATFAVRRTRLLNTFIFENADLRGKVDLKAVGGWTVEVTPRAIYLASHTIANALALARRIANGFGTVNAERLRRFDSAADYVGFSLDNIVDRLLTQRAKCVGFIVDEKDVDDASEASIAVRLQEHRDRHLNVTGVSISPGNSIMARIYNKSQELLLPGREAKLEIERARWRAGGWDGLLPVTRVEFQHRGTYLDEVGLRDPDRLERMLDPVWQSSVRWVRLIDPASHSRKSRCALDPRWSEVTSTIFSHEAAPIERSRKHRGGARPEHVLGSTISFLSASGTLRSRRDLALLCETNLDTISEAEARIWLHEAIALVGARASREIARDRASRGDAREQGRRLQTKIKASLARFSSEDDQSEVIE